MLQLGLFLPAMEGWLGDRWLPRWPELARLATLAEAVGFDAVFVPDHLIIGPVALLGHSRGRVARDLGGLDAPRRARRGDPACRDRGVRHRRGLPQPALLAKMAVTVDEVSGGRLILGLGCGSHPPEYTAFGYPYDHRVDRFEEVLQILVPLLREGRVDFVGRYHTARACELLPRGPRPGGPPIWIAAYQPRMMRLAARWGDAFVTAWHPERGRSRGAARASRRRVQPPSGGIRRRSAAPWASSSGPARGRIALSRWARSAARPRRSPPGSSRFAPRASATSSACWIPGRRRASSASPR